MTTSRPAAPEPLPSVDSLAWQERAEYAERQLSLAQTEIKGHMRVVDDLKADYARAREFIEQQGKRIAELEKALAEHGTDAPGGIFS